MTEPHVDVDELVALVLQEVEPEQRARLSAHLEGCPRCRVEYAGVEEAVQHTLTAAPSVAPSAGFSGRVLAELGLAGPAAGRSPAVRPGHRWRWPVAAAAALVVGLAVGIGGTLVATAPPDSISSVPGGATSAATLVTRSGDTVGTAGTAVLSGREYLLITVTQARPGAAYECLVVGTDGRRHPAGDWTLNAGDGTTTASGSWLVEAPPGEVARVELVTRSGSVWAQAEL